MSSVNLTNSFGGGLSGFSPRYTVLADACSRMILSRRDGGMRLAIFPQRLRGNQYFDHTEKVNDPLFVGGQCPKRSAHLDFSWEVRQSQKHAIASRSRRNAHRSINSL